MTKKVVKTTSTSIPASRTNQKLTTHNQPKRTTMKRNAPPPAQIAAEKERYKRIASDEFLELALSASNKKSALSYAKKALKQNRENIKAEQMVAELSSHSQHDLIKHLAAALKHTTGIIERAGYFTKEFIGHFWKHHETRTYLELRCRYAHALYRAQMMHLAIAEYEELLQLDRQDHLFVRYYLVALYVALEDEDSAIDLHRRFGRAKETAWLFNLSLLYFKRGNLRRAHAYLKDLKKINSDLNQALDTLAKLDIATFYEKLNSSKSTYSVETLSELYDTFSIIGTPLLVQDNYIAWAQEQLTK